MFSLTEMGTEQAVWLKTQTIILDLCRQSCPFQVNRLFFGFSPHPHIVYNLCWWTLMPQLENSIIDQRGSINCGEISRVLVLVFVKLSASAAPPRGIAIEGINLGGRTNQIWISAGFREQHQHQAAVILFISFLYDLGSIISSVISAVASCWILLIYFIPSP